MKTEAKELLKRICIGVLCVGAIFYIGNQDLETRYFFGIAFIILYVAWLGQQRFEQLSKERFYHCIYEKDIIAVDSDEVLVTLKIKDALPFVPYIGLSVVGDKSPVTDSSIDIETHDFGEYYTGKIIDVCWRYSRFVCKVEPHKMTSSNNLGSVILAYYEFQWEVDLMFFRIRETLETNLNEIELKLSSEKEGDTTTERKRFLIEKLRKRLS